MALGIHKSWLILFCVVSICYGGQQAIYSKFASAGQLYIGDSIDKFEKIIGVKPKFCAHCKSNERFAAIGGSYDEDGLIGESFEFLFRDHKLVLIVINPVNYNLTEHLKYYEDKLKKNADIKKIDNAKSSARWVVDSTVIDITYNFKTNEVIRVAFYEDKE